MRSGRNLEQTPGLVDADVADDVGSNVAAVGVAGSAGEAEALRQVVHGGAVEDDRIIEADGAGHAVAEVRGVLDVVHAGDGVMTAEQERGVVARITMPRRGVGRSRLTEGEPSELDEHHFDGHIAFTRLVQQTGNRSGRAPFAK